MKIFAIIGSPKGKGNTYKITKRVEEKMKELGDIEFEYLFLKDANLKLCKGCFTCFTKGEDKCPLKDDRAKIEEQILQSDGVILACPVYVMNVTWLMKNFIDRFAFTWHRPRFFDQKLLLISTVGGIGLKPAFKTLSSTLGGANLVHKIGIMTPPFRPTPAYKKEIEKEIAKTAAKYYSAIKKKKRPCPGIMMLLWFKSFKAISKYARDVMQADYEYYKTRKNYFYDTKVNWFKNSIASLMVKLLVRGLKKKFIGSEDKK